MAKSALLTIFLAAALACAACFSEPRQAPGPALNLVVVCIDTLRVDHLSAYGYARKTTPFIDDLARQGTLFTKAYAHSDWTVPSTASLLTSLYPSEHGAGIAGEMRQLGEDTPILQMGKNVETLAVWLRRAGFRTGLFSANPFLFGRFQQDFEAAEVGRKSASELTSAGLRWLDGVESDRFFLYLQYMDLHQPIEPPPPYFDLFPVVEGGARSREHSDWSYGTVRDQRDLDDPAFRRFRAHRSALYDGALRFIDAEVRRLLSQLELASHARDTLVVVTSDHGEEFWDHALTERETGHDPRGIWGIGHGHTMYEELLRVPLILHGPGVAVNRKVGCVARHVDVVPTALGLLGLPLPASVRGRSLIPLRGSNSGSETCAEVPVVAESPAYGPDSRTVIWKGRKLVVRSTGGDFLFDLRRDPGERRNLRSANPRLAAGLETILQRELSGRRASAPGDTLAIDEETQRELRALGYLQ